MEEHRWASGNRGPYIKTFYGNKVFIGDPRPEDFTIEDIARNLAGINRYVGASRYTVAQHCVVAAKMAELHYPGHRGSMALLPARMLIHDADEAFVGDVSSPLKSLLPDYKRVEDAMQLAMEKFFDLTFIGDPLVKELDYRMWLTEREQLFNGRHGEQSDDYKGALEPFDYWNTGDFMEWPADEAEDAYLEACRKYFPALV